MNEYDIIETILRSARRLPRGFSSIGDDVAIVPTGKGRLVVKSDMLVSKTDVPPTMTYRQAARKSVAMCVSDFAAKGVAPSSFLISLGVPRGISDSEVNELATGFADASKEWSLNLVGGDTGEAGDLTIDCTMFGFSNKIVPRSGAEPGQLIVVSGDFGYPSSGLKILQERARAEPSFRRKALQSVYMPTPKLGVGIALSNYLSSSMDSSDGLAICLHTLAEMSGVGMSVNLLPCKIELERFGGANGYSVEDLVLYGGEEYEIVGTMTRGRLKEAATLASKLTVIGETTAEKGKVVLQVRGKKKKEVQKKGWIHLS